MNSPVEFLTGARKKLFCIAAISAFGLFANALSDDWPQWRGPARDGIVAGKPWPRSLTGDALTLQWRVELGPSYSGPIVAGDRVIVTETRDKKYEAAIAFDRTTGKQLWRTQWEGSLSVPFFAKSNGDWIRATPACDGDAVFIAGMRDVLACLDLQTGAERWRVDFPVVLKTPLPAFGFVSSPLLSGEFLYVQAGASVVKLRKQSGEVVWRALADEGGMWGSAFSSPVLAELGGRQQLVTQTRTTLAGIEPETGAVLWKQPVEAFRGMNILTPVVVDDLVFTSTYGGKTIGFKVSQENGNRIVTPAWTIKQQGYMSTPVVVDGHAYHHLRSERLTCIDLKQGVERWTSTKSFGKYMSLVAQGDQVLGLDQRGMLVLFKASPKEFELVDSFKLSEAETWAHLAVAGDQLFVRELHALAAFHWQVPSLGAARAVSEAKEISSP